MFDKHFGFKKGLQHMQASYQDGGLFIIFAVLLFLGIDKADVVNIQNNKFVPYQFWLGHEGYQQPYAF